MEKNCLTCEYRRGGEKGDILTYCAHKLAKEMNYTCVELMIKYCPYQILNEVLP